MVNISISGAAGSGKTCLLTFFALALVDEGKKVYSNYFIDSPSCSLIGIYELAQLLRAGLDNPKNSPLFNGVVCGSELYGWIESRRSAAKENVLFSYFVFQCRKLGFDVLYDCQLLSTVDVRLRELTDLSFEAERVEGGFRYWLLDREGVAAGDAVRTGKSFMLPLELCKTFWNRYESYKVVEPLGYEDLLIEMEKFSPVHKKKRIADQVELLSGHLEFFPLGRVDVASVRYALLMLDESDAFDAEVCVGLKLRLLQSRGREQKRVVLTSDRYSVPRWSIRR